MPKLVRSCYETHVAPLHTTLECTGVHFIISLCLALVEELKRKTSSEDSFEHEFGIAYLSLFPSLVYQCSTLIQKAGQCTEVCGAVKI